MKKIGDFLTLRMGLILQEALVLIKLRSDLIDMMFPLDFISISVIDDKRVSPGHPPSVNIPHG